MMEHQTHSKPNARNNQVTEEATDPETKVWIPISHQIHIKHQVKSSTYQIKSPITNQTIHHR